MPPQSTPSGSPNPAEEIQRRTNSLSFKIDTLQDKANLKSVIDDFTNVESDINNLSGRISALRQRKYVFNKLLEAKASDFSIRWMSQKAPIQAQINLQANRLQSNFHALQLHYTTSGRPLSTLTLDSLEREAEMVENQCSSAEDSLEEMYKNIEDEAYAFKKELEMIEYSLDQAETASFGFLPEEAVVKAVKAIWCKTGKEQKDDPEGVLFLTDQRLIFEQKEEVATKKVLFVTTERQKVQNMLFEVPVASIYEINSTKQGLFKNIDMLEVKLDPGCFSDKATLHLFDQPCEEWQKQVGQVKNHEIDSLRIVPVQQAVIDKVKNAPTQCPYCNGAITKPILRGQDSIKCDFCGMVIKL